MPTAALADVHGNLHALDAVLADPRLAEADRIVVLGDVVTGTFPAETLDRLTALPGRVSFLRGNADRLALDDPGDWYGWVRERLGSERLATVRAWPLTFAIDVDGLGSVRCCHAVPSDDERVLTRVTPEADFAGELEGIEEASRGRRPHARPVRPSRRPWRYVNVGAVGRPYEGRPGAYWAMLGRTSSSCAPTTTSRQRPRRFSPRDSPMRRRSPRHCFVRPRPRRPRPGGRSLGFRDEHGRRRRDRLRPRDQALRGARPGGGREPVADHPRGRDLRPRRAVRRRQDDRDEARQPADRARRGRHHDRRDERSATRTRSSCAAASAT